MPTLSEKKTRKKIRPLDNFDKALLSLLRVAEGHLPSVAKILRVHSATASRKFCAKRRRHDYRKILTARTRDGEKSRLRRWNWRLRMQAIGIDPHTLTPDDPAWFLCHRLPRGSIVTCVADYMRTERPSIDFRVTEDLEELIERIMLLLAAYDGQRDRAVFAVRDGAPVPLARRSTPPT